MSTQGAEFVYRIFIGKPAEEVWRALTEKPLVDQYYMVPLQHLDLQPGGKVSYGADKAFISGRVETIEAPTKLVHTFRFAGCHDPESLVAYEIEALSEEMCLLTISHSRLSLESPTYANISGGWPVIASSLKTLLETGECLPWPQR